jgi:hypothetical protein
MGRQENSTMTKKKKKKTKPKGNESKWGKTEKKPLKKQCSLEQKY